MSDQTWTPQQYEAINDSGTNIIVSAGAGSGKTAVLTERVYKHITIDHYNIDEMLVLTFTEAAAKEMKKRIKEKITKNEGNVLSSERRAEQLNKIDSSYIMTFDAYALGLVQKYHYLLNVNKDVSIVTGKILEVRKKEYLDEIMESHYVGDTAFRQMVSRFCDKNDNKIREWVNELDSKLKMRYDRDDYLDSYLKEYYNEEKVDELFEDYVASLRAQVEYIETLYNRLNRYVDVETIYPHMNELLASFDYNSIRQNCRMDIKNLPRGAEQEAKDLKNDIKKELDKLVSKTHLEEDELKEIYLNSKETAEVLIRLLKEYDFKIREYKRQNNVYEFNDIFNMALTLLSEYPEVRSEVKNSFKEILIDEYQDTNDLQEEFIEYLNEGNNIYMVGDIKQSIYRFRNANPDLFMAKYNRYSNSDGGKSIELLENFRSRAEVLEDINSIFERIMDETVGGVNYDDKQKMVAGFKEYETLKDPKHDNYLEILSYDKEAYPLENKEAKPEVVEAVLIANDILSKKASGLMVVNDKQMKKVSYSDFCIIVDRSNYFDTYKKILTYYNIPSVIIQDESLKDTDLLPAVKSIFGLLTCLNTSDDTKLNYYFMSLARSFLVEMSDSEIYDLIKNNQVKECELMKKIEEISKQADSCSVSELLDIIIEEFEVYDRLNKIGEVSDNINKINFLYTLSHELNDMGYSYKDFNDFMDKVFEKSSNKNDDLSYKSRVPEIDAVKIMTMHKSKGLEFSVCYYPHLNNEFNKGDLLKAVTYNRNYGIIVPGYIEGKGRIDTFVADIYREQLQREESSEKIRLLYVALTRAKEKMVLVYPAKEKNSDNSGTVDLNLRLNLKMYSSVLNVLYRMFDDKGYIKQPDLNSISFSSILQEVRQPVFSKIKPGNEIIVKYPVTVEPKEIVRERYSKLPTLVTPEQQRNMDEGTRLHYYLETLDFNNPDYSVMDKLSRIRIKRFVESDLMKDIANGKTYREYEFIEKKDGKSRHGFIDLLVEYDDHFDIIDYKLKGIDDEHYDQQLQGYREYISSISDKPVNCYLYSIMDGNWRRVE